MQLTWGVATDAGRVRLLNEDAVVAGPSVFAVADGMGGQAAGDVASTTTARRLSALDRPGPLHAADVELAIGTAQRDMAALMAADPAVAEMGTTLSGLACVDAGGAPHWYVFNVGDSRTYRCRDGSLEQLTVDHSEVQELIQQGALTPSAARAHPRRNVITRALGPREMPLVDSWLLPAAAGDRFLVCSDGLINELAESDVIAVLDTQPDDGVAAELLVRLAVDAGGRDNVSVVVVSAAPVGADEPPEDEDTTPRPLVGSP